ncbi:methyltransferase domain-containing protein [Blastopirellula sp. JC732]|uniref:Methyltransferase domain-containing protein n=1 Tax=Blastopirellula sediminis TaxID=2894196 RepID=A0A9X1MM56_9BACT|nr:methyltransferase domain-containing protein [Blastopirellula sediminis]MCC9607029.1 methyltransferase domain-containing protein [Blastopirellula sediminis]MCC9629678.1 methyltransferase domain-containing protein [Blastopirellula sediminis]
MYRSLVLYATILLGMVAAANAVAQEKAPAVEQSVKPGVNANFLDESLDVNAWIERFEVESREVYHAREEVLKAAGIKPGMRIADVGAGSGFYTRLFARAVGPTGWVYAVDISPKFLQHVSSSNAELGLNNITCVLGGERSIQLPADSVDLVFICDTYHHFEYPQSTLASIHQALRSDGTLVVIDFERIPGESRDWTLDHVRAGKETFRQEIEQAGFTLAEEPKIESFKENYFLRFRKKSAE